MKNKRKKLNYLLLALLLVIVGCGGRIPSPETSQRISKKHFQKYGKKFKESDFGQHKVEKVEIAGVQEVQKNVVEVISYVYLTDSQAYRIRLTLQKKPFGWKVLAWENLGAPE